MWFIYIDCFCCFLKIQSYTITRVQQKCLLFSAYFLMVNNCRYDYEPISKVLHLPIFTDRRTSANI